MSAATELKAPKLWIVLARCYRALALSVERSMADLGLCLSDFMVLEALLHKGPLTISEIVSGPLRSEEHTSELQSHHDLVCRLLLEKKKQKCTQSNSTLTRKQ